MKISTYVVGTFLSASLLCPAMASAQIYDGASAGFQDEFGVQASVGIKIPLGATDHRKLKDQPRLSFGVDLTRTTSSSQTGQWARKRVSLLDVGTYGSDDFSLQFSGQELYGPTLSTLHADEADDPDAAGEPAKKDSNNTVEWIIGGVVVVTVGVLVAGAIIANEIEEGFE